MAARKLIARKSGRSSRSVAKQTRAASAPRSAAPKPRQKPEPRQAGSRVSPLTAAREAVTKDLLPADSLEEALEHERVHLMQVHAMLKCLYEVLLYADDDDSIMHAEVACTAARLLSDSAVRLDSVNLRPLIEAIRRGRGGAPVEYDKYDSDVTRHGPYQVKEPTPVYLV